MPIESYIQPPNFFQQAQCAQQITRQIVASDAPSGRKKQHQRKKGGVGIAKPPLLKLFLNPPVALLSRLCASHSRRCSSQKESECDGVSASEKE